jgi:hypothetical protein
MKSSKRILALGGNATHPKPRWLQQETRQRKVPKRRNRKSQVIWDGAVHCCMKE